MKIVRKSALYILLLLSVLVILASLLSLFYDLTYWYSKVLDFPRLQYLLVALGCLLLFVLLNKKWGPSSFLLCLGLVAAVLIQSRRIYPYVLGEKAVPDVSLATVGQGNRVDVLLANVLVTNREAGKLLKIVEQADPDMILMMEVDEWWVNKLQPLKKEYPHVIEYPLDNAYGLALYSKFPLKDPEILFFQHEDVPSFHARVELPSGRAFRFHGVHPVAPVPSERYPDNVGKEEVTLLKVGKLVVADSLPSIVAGDYNDVSWSHTARLFGQEGELNNVRIGRGLYNTYDAKAWPLRWPLDHFFVTKEFALLGLDRLPLFNSDHFPIIARLVLKQPKR